LGYAFPIFEAPFSTANLGAPGVFLEGATKWRVVRAKNASWLTLGKPWLKPGLDPGLNYPALCARMRRALNIFEKRKIRRCAKNFETGI
jgi:hypothetical protein